MDENNWKNKESNNENNVVKRESPIMVDKKKSENNEELVSKRNKRINLEEIKIEPKDVYLKSKELKGLFTGDTIKSKTIEESKGIQPIKISIQDENLQTLKNDLVEIGQNYPQLIRNVELENSSNSKVNMQAIVDEIYNIRNKYKGTVESAEPISITIASNNQEDFNLDFSGAPKVVNSENTTNPIEIEGNKQQVIFKNLNESKSIVLPSTNGKISPNIDGITFDGFDLSNVDLRKSDIKKICLKSKMTKNVDAIIMKPRMAYGVELEALNDAELNKAISRFSDVHDLKIKNQDLKNRKILQELSINPNLVFLTIQKSRLNNIDGLEQFDGRIKHLALYSNDLSISDLERLNNFYENNEYLELYTNNNTGILKEINSSTPISNESYKYIDNIYRSSGDYKEIANSKEAVDSLLWSGQNIPYYIKDSKTIRQKLKITTNPMMIEKDEDFNNFDFNEDYMKDGTLLLSVNQAEKLLSLGKIVPQQIRIKIEDVSQLSVDKAKDLENRFSALGMRITGVQIFDKDIDNTHNCYAPYSLSEYKYIRRTLDLVVDGIDKNDPDIDKFAMVYQRLMDNITYDNDACNHDTSNEAIYYAEKLNNSRNLYSGLKDGKCVCAGYADILRNALKLVDVESRYNSGCCKKGNDKTGHAWNQIQLDDGTGTKKWYYTDLTWDAINGNHNYTLKGKNEFISNRHEETKTEKIEQVSDTEYNRDRMNQAFVKAKIHSFNLKNRQEKIKIPKDPDIEIEEIDKNKVKLEFERRKQDMYAKFYGNREYLKEYMERSKRFRQHEIQKNDGNIEYKTIEDYIEKEEDERFLLLDKYKESLERMSKYEAGDTSVYTGTEREVNNALMKDREYVETKNHTFDQNKSTNKDLATLGKYGELVPYIPKQNGFLKNTVRTLSNAGIFTRNLVSPIYRGIGKYVAQPIHKMVVRNREASPFRNNIYHRMVSRRDYFEEKNNQSNPGHSMLNAIKSRCEAIFKSKEGNEAVLRAGASDIKENIVKQQREIIILKNLESISSEYEKQIKDIKNNIENKVGANNIEDAKRALKEKVSKKRQIEALIRKAKESKTETKQTDAISDKQHAIASKEVTTMKVTAIKGVAKGIAVKYIGPKIHEWLLERGKTTKPIQITTQVQEQKQRWVDPTYKETTVPIYKDVIDGNKSMNDIIEANKGKNITGYYSVYGGENKAATYNLTGNENITAIFEAQGKGGTGISDTAGLSAPMMTDRSFGTEFLNSNGVLSQDTTIQQLIEALNTGDANMDSLQNLYVSIGDNYWAKLSDLTEMVTQKVKVGEQIQKVLDVAGHTETYSELVNKVINTVEVVNDPKMVSIIKALKAAGKVGMAADGTIDVAENIRKTRTDVKNNKARIRNYEFETDEEVPKTRKEYKKKMEEER